MTKSAFPRDEEDFIRDEFWHIKPDQVVLDVGACEGTYTLPALKAGATVYAVDGRAAPLAMLLRHAQANHLDERLTVAYRSLYDGSKYPTELNDSIRNGPHESSRTMVPDAEWSTVDQLVEFWDLDRLDWLKIDVEGGELGVIQGANLTLRQFRPNVLIEDHLPVYSWVTSEKRDAMLALLELHGYDTVLITDSYPGYVMATYGEA